MGERFKSTRGGDFAMARQGTDPSRLSGLLREEVDDDAVTFSSRIEYSSDSFWVEISRERIATFVNSAHSPPMP
jgi:hypothetical protein